MEWIIDRSHSSPKPNSKEKVSKSEEEIKKNCLSLTHRKYRTKWMEMNTWQRNVKYITVKKEQQQYATTKTKLSKVERMNQTLGSNKRVFFPFFFFIQWTFCVYIFFLFRSYCYSKIRVCPLFYTIYLVFPRLFFLLFFFECEINSFNQLVYSSLIF